MLTKEEQRFIDYWSQNRDKKTRMLIQLAFGLPMGVAIVAALFVNIASGWHKRAGMIIRSNASLLLVILVAVVVIVVFIAIFSVRYKWEQREQRYRELLSKQQKQQ